MSALIVAFVGGFVIETMCVFWVHYSERERATATALCSMSIAIAQVLGLGEAVRDAWAAPFYVAGFGAGTYLAVRFKRRVVALLDRRS